jgi:hypothetical protein
MLLIHFRMTALGNMVWGVLSWGGSLELRPYRVTSNVLVLVLEGDLTDGDAADRVVSFSTD